MIVHSETPRPRPPAPHTTLLSLYTIYTLFCSTIPHRAPFTLEPHTRHAPATKKRYTNAKSHGCRARIATKPAGPRDVLRGGCATASTAGACRAPSRSRRTDPLDPAASSSPAAISSDAPATPARGSVGARASTRVGLVGSHGAGGRRAGGRRTWHEVVVGREHEEEDERRVSEWSTSSTPSSGLLCAPAPPAIQTLAGGRL